MVGKTVGIWCTKKEDPSPEQGCVKLGMPSSVVPGENKWCHRTRLYTHVCPAYTTVATQGAAD